MSTMIDPAASDPAFRSLPDTARLWIFGTDRPLAPGEAEQLLQEVDAFVGGWKAHGHPLSAGRAWHMGRFLMVAVDDRVEAPSGCSIDALVRTLRTLEGELDLEMVGGGPLYLRKEEGDGPEAVERLTRAEFRARAGRGEVTALTRVFDPTVDRLEGLRQGDFERPVADSWHRSLLPAGDAPAPS